MTITGGTRVYGLLGAPVAHSLSPRLCNAAFASLGEDAVYVALPSDAARPADLVAGLDALGLAGANVTYPLKAAVMPHLVEVSEAARRVGAVNVLVRAQGGGFRGENTDAPGLVLALQTWAAQEPAAARVVVIGAGGAARAAAHGLLQAGAPEVVLLARDPARAAAGLDDLVTHGAGGRATAAALDGPEGRRALAAATLVVQATPVGLDDPHARPLVMPDQAPAASGFELNYGAGPTAFVRAWRAAGRRCLDGRDLLTAQAHLALRLWLGRAPDLAAMRRTIGQEGDPA
ncbi:MAG: shikimate dehydrogenase [Candidatus Krumholzibacteriia bacterium]